MDYANGKIYKITNCVNDQVYVGSTCTPLTKRFSYHKKQRFARDNPLTKLMIELGTDKFSISLIEDYPCTNHTELFRKEGEYIRELGTLNQRIAGRTHNEWNQEHRDLMNERSKLHRENNVEHYKQYRQANKEKKAQRQSQRWTCDRCGSECSFGSKSTHMKTNKCINFVTII
jgi:glucan phosphorylase